MNHYIHRENLSIDRALHQLMVEQILPGLDISETQAWQALAALLQEFTSTNQQLLQKRQQLQTQITQWHQDNPNFKPQASLLAYKKMLQSIGYLAPQPAYVNVTTTNVDTEITTIAGPQLVVPINNARYALNACNARWGSLYDALYGADVIAGTTNNKGYNQDRGAQVIAYGKAFLDKHLPLSEGSHANAQSYSVVNEQLCITLNDKLTTGLANPTQFVGYTRDRHSPSSILLKNNQLHIELVINPNSPVGQQDLAHVADIVMEAAISTIMDCEDSVAAVDAEDKALVYSNWLGLMKGDLAINMEKNGKTIQRTLHEDRHYQNPQGEPLTLHGRSLLFVRNVGHLMTTHSILNNAGEAIPEGIMDGFFTTLCAMHDLQNTNNTIRNSRQGSIYIVKPKMHGPEEVTFTVSLFSRIEALLGLPHNTLKIGIMDEERRTSVNLKACIAAASERVCFINTGFLDRTGDEIHTSMAAGAMVAKGDMKGQAWISIYEKNNVAIGLNCGLQGKAQIGKGMWAKPDCMAEMLATKIEHPLAGANTAWVPSPTGATLHAMHYHQVNVPTQQNRLKHSQFIDADLLLQVPLLEQPEQFTPTQIKRELDNNCQGILGYVVRWVEAGIGCSKVPDINQEGLMEDRATLRISSQAIANWLEHGICDPTMVIESMQRMALLVDQQNTNDPTYQTMAPDFDKSLGYQAALALVFEGKNQPNGYTEPLLHKYRLLAKAQVG